MISKAFTDLIGNSFTYFLIIYFQWKKSLQGLIDENKIWLKCELKEKQQKKNKKGKGLYFLKYSKRNELDCQRLL